MSGRQNRINRRTEKKEQDQFILDSLAESSTPVEPALKDTNPEYDIQESAPQELVPPLRENIVTAAAASTSKRGIYNNSSEDSSDSFDLDEKKLISTTSKKKDGNTSPITANIPIILNMSGFDTEMT